MRPARNALGSSSEFISFYMHVYAVTCAVSEFISCYVHVYAVTCVFLVYDSHVFTSTADI